MWNHINEINPKETAILVIDMQNIFVKEGGSMYCKMGNEMLDKMANFLDQCRIRKIQVIYTVYDETKDEWEKIHEKIESKVTDKIIIKIVYSAFRNTVLDETLKELGIKVVVIVGVMSDVCCLATAHDAQFLGYKVAFISDLTGTKDFPDLGFGAGNAKEQHIMILRNIEYTTGHVITADNLLKLPMKEIE